MPVACPHCSREFDKPRVDPRHLAKCALPTGPSIEPCLCGQGSASLPSVPEKTLHESVVRLCLPMGRGELHVKPT